MGIRFFCPQGHRLNVKSFLAGKRGVCPDCGAHVDIPMESDARAVSTKKKSAKAVGGDDAGMKATALLEQPEAERAEIEHREIDISLPAPKASHNDFALPASLGLPPVAPDQAAVPPKVSTIATPQFALESVRPAATVIKADAAAPAPETAAPDAAVPAPPAPTARPASNGAPRGVAVATLAASPATAQSPAASDPIAEAPMAIWYVRPSAGGQYGPARGDVMRKWVGEGRVTTDSLVWREGWPDWRPAAKVFPDLASKSPAASEQLPVVTEAPRRPVRPSRKPSTGQGVGIVIAMGVVCVILFVALIWVLNNSGGTVAPTP